jgi:transposase InsO family protein
MFRCESAMLKTHWVLVVMDQYTRRIIGFAVHAGPVDGIALCRMFNRAIRGQPAPKYLSTDHDPLYRFHRWLANLRLLDITEIKTIPYAPLSHPFIERLIGTVRRECLDKTLFWNERDLERKLVDFKNYYNRYRTHEALNDVTPAICAELTENKIIDLNNYPRTNSSKYSTCPWRCPMIVFCTIATPELQHDGDSKEYRVRKRND